MVTARPSRWSCANLKYSFLTLCRVGGASNDILSQLWHQIAPDAPKARRGRYRRALRCCVQRTVNTDTATREARSIWRTTNSQQVDIERFSALAQWQRAFTSKDDGQLNRCVARRECSELRTAKTLTLFFRKSFAQTVATVLPHSFASCARVRHIHRTGCRLAICDAVFNLLSGHPQTNQDHWKQRHATDYRRGAVKTLTAAILSSLAPLSFAQSKDLIRAFCTHYRARWRSRKRLERPSGP